MNEVAYQTLIVKFSEPIKALDGMFDDAEAWGVDTLKGWIDNYESSRFTAIDSHTAVITSEYNMEWLKVSEEFFRFYLKIAPIWDKDILSYYAGFYYWKCFT